MPQTAAAPHHRLPRFGLRRPRWLLGLIPALLLLTALPLAALAQPNPPHFFAGTVTINGAAAPDGTTVAALIGGQEVASTAVKGGRYSLKVPGSAGQAIAFTVGEWSAEESANFEQGQRTPLNLTASGRPAATPPPGPTPTAMLPAPTPAPQATPAPPAPTPTPYPTPAPTPEPRPAAGSVAEAFDEPLAGDALLAVWVGNDEETGEPTPLLDTPAEFSAGRTLHRGDIVWVKLTRALEWEGQRLVAGWNLVRIP